MCKNLAMVAIEVVFTHLLFPVSKDAVHGAGLNSQSRTYTFSCTLTVYSQLTWLCCSCMISPHSLI